MYLAGGLRVYTYGHKYWLSTGLGISYPPGKCSVCEFPASLGSMDAKFLHTDRNTITLPEHIQPYYTASPWKNGQRRRHIIMYREIQQKLLRIFIYCILYSYIIFVMAFMYLAGGLRVYTYGPKYWLSTDLGVSYPPGTCPACDFFASLRSLEAEFLYTEKNTTLLCIIIHLHSQCHSINMGIFGDTVKFSREIQQKLFHCAQIFIHYIHTLL